jgi:CheY-like chemotaxis protein
MPTVSRAWARCGQRPSRAAPSSWAGASPPPALPLARRAAHAATIRVTRSAGAAAFDMSRLDILVVDDDADIREALKLALELEGYETVAARHGGEAWELLSSGRVPALVLLDLAMPVLDGPGLLARIRGTSALGSLPVVILTAFGSLADGVRALAQGCLFKPVDLDAVLSVAAHPCPAGAAG